MNVGHIYRYYNQYGKYHDYVVIYEICNHTYTHKGQTINNICAMGINIADSTDIRAIAKEVWRHWEEVET